MTVGYRNPYLAGSQNPIAHGRCDQQDCTPITGALPSGGPHGGEVLGTADVQHTWLGPGHFGGLISGEYPDGRRVIWSNGRERLVKLDYDTLEVLATLDVRAVGSILYKQEAMGLGDVKLMAVLGAFLGWKGILLTFLLGCLAGAVFGAGYFLVKRRLRGVQVPFGPFLALGAMLVIFFTPEVNGAIRAYLDMFRSA